MDAKTIDARRTQGSVMMQLVLDMLVRAPG